MSCSAQTQNEAQALQSLREMTKDGKMPSEQFVQQIENRFANTRTGALAKLMRAKIRFDAGDFEGAANILNTDLFKQKTKLADYALWFRGRSLQSAGKHAEAMNVFSALLREHPNSLKARESKILWANSALQIGQAAQIPDFLKDLNQADAFLLTAKSFEAQNNQLEAIKFYRKTYFYGAGTNEAKEAEIKLATFNIPLNPQTAEEIAARADRFYNLKNYVEAEKSYNELMMSFASSAAAQTHLRRLITFANVKKMSDAQNAFNAIQPNDKLKEEAFYQLAMGYAKNRLWAQARTTIDEMRQKFPAGNWTPRTLIDVGTVARDAKNTTDANYFFRTAVSSYPNAINVAGAQFELAWTEHENKNFATSSQMLIEHLARYTDKDSTNRGKAGYWAARDSERAGKMNEACALYDAVTYRYSSNWYGYLGLQRLSALRSQGNCQSTPTFSSDSLVPKAAKHLKMVMVAAETSGAKEIERIEKGDELTIVGLFDWAITELEEAKKTANNSPKINLALAKHYRLKGNQVGAFSALRPSYPDYAQMFPEELGQAEWDIFYPLTHWNDIKYWANQRRLDKYEVAGFIRQETIFDPRAKSPANAYGMMQLLVPTARSVAKKYNASTTQIFAETLYNPQLNIELGTAYIRDQYDKFGRTEFVAIAYNAGPGRVPQWRATLPAEIDDFVENIPFKETKAYVQGIIRNTAQYRRLYEESGNFKSNVGSKPLRGEIDEKPREEFNAQFPEIILDESRSD
ncbi:MAG TPA: transglycosylase SLT domain-containing protein [Pyrinomonadaceae bacterium]|nr:transglycosylase SLT domain-containing protein [Pyrinomonadaceae bacterium]